MNSFLAIYSFSGKKSLLWPDAKKCLSQQVHKTIFFSTGKKTHTFLSENRHFLWIRISYEFLKRYIAKHNIEKYKILVISPSYSGDKNSFFCWKYSLFFSLSTFQKIIFVQSFPNWLLHYKNPSNVFLRLRLLKGYGIQGENITYEKTFLLSNIFRISS